MTHNDIVQKTFQSQLRQVDIEEYCEQEQATTEAFCDEFALCVATGYMDGRFNYVSADTAIASLFYHFSPNVPEFARSVFDCFDEGEYRHTKGADADEITKACFQKWKLNRF